MSCPIDDNTKDKKPIITASKALRQQFFGIKEEKVCSKCPFVGTCSHKNKPASSPEASLQDVTTLLAALYFSESERPMTVYNSATVLLKSVEDIMADLCDNNGLEFKLFMAELTKTKHL